MSRTLEISFNLSTLFVILFLAMIITKETFDDHVRGIAEVAAEVISKDAKKDKINPKILTDDNPLSNFFMFMIKAKIAENSVYRDFVLFSTLSAKNKIVSIGVLGNVFVLIDEEKVKDFNDKKKPL
jgi:hypothetical protein